MYLCFVLDPGVKYETFHTNPDVNYRFFCRYHLLRKFLSIPNILEGFFGGVAPCSLWNSRARDQIWAKVATYTRAVAMPASLTHCAGQGSNLHPGTAEMLPIPLCQRELLLEFLWWMDLEFFDWFQFSFLYQLILNFFVQGSGYYNSQAKSCSSTVSVEAIS